MACFVVFRTERSRALGGLARSRVRSCFFMFLGAAVGFFAGRDVFPPRPVGCAKPRQNTTKKLRRTQRKRSILQGASVATPQIRCLAGSIGFLAGRRLIFHSIPQAALKTRQKTSKKLHRTHVFLCFYRVAKAPLVVVNTLSELPEVTGR